MVSRRAVLSTGTTGAIALSVGCLDLVLGDGPLEFDAAKVLPTEEALAETGYEESDSGWEQIEETVDVGEEREVNASIWTALYSKRVTISAADLDDVDVENAAALNETDLDESDLEEYQDKLEDVDLDDVDPDDYENLDEEDLEEYQDELEDGELEREAAMFAAISMPAMEVVGSTQNPIADMETRELLEEFQDKLEGQYGDIRDISHDETVDLPILGAERTVDRYVGTVTLEDYDVDIAIHVTLFEHEGDVLVLLGGYPRALPDERDGVETLLQSVEHPLE